MQQNFSNVIDELHLNNEKLKQMVDHSKTIDSSLEKAKFFRDSILNQMKIIRELYDGIEVKIAEFLKPFPNYDDILYIPVAQS